MKKLIAYFSLIVVLLAGFHARAGIIAGPITNPKNGHDYYLLSPDSWTASEVEAEHLGGTLAIVKNAAEQSWIFSTFGAYDGTNRNLWIGLYRTNPNRSLVWATGEKLNYVNWAGGQPDDNGRIEGYVFVASGDRPWGFPAGGWADCADDANVGGSTPQAVVEVPGKSREKSLRASEKALLGLWYASGRADSPCHIARTEHALFVINESNGGGRVIITPEGNLFVAPWRISGEIVQDKILWSNGTWWSREPLGYKKGPLSNKGESNRSSSSTAF